MVIISLLSCQDIKIHLQAYNCQYYPFIPRAHLMTVHIDVYSSLMCVILQGQFEESKSFFYLNWESVLEIPQTGLYCICWILITPNYLNLYSVVIKRWDCKRSSVFHSGYPCIEVTIGYVLFESNQQKPFKGIVLMVELALSGNDVKIGIIVKVEKLVRLFPSQWRNSLCGFPCTLGVNPINSVKRLRWGQ